MTRKPPTPADYEIGYGCPPAHTRFKPGESGNPAGRRKAPKTVGQTLEGILNQRIPVQEGGRKRHMTLQEVMLRKLAADAARGDLKSIKLLMKLQSKYSGSTETTVDPDTLSPEDQAILARYLPNGFNPQEPSAESENRDE